MKPLLTINLVARYYLVKVTSSVASNVTIFAGDGEELLVANADAWIEALPFQIDSSTCEWSFLLLR